MELVRAYIALGFKSQKTIHPKDVNQIVDRYLAGDDLQTIAKEEALRIRNEFRREHISIHHTETPQKPNPSAPRYEGQRPEDTMEEHEVRNKMMGWNSMMLISSFLVVVTNVAVAISRIAFDYEFSFPIGVIPLPLLICTLIMRQMRSDELHKMKRKRMDQEIIERW